MKVNLTATEGRLVVKTLPNQEQTSGGLFLSQPSNPDIHKGIIESVGPYKKDVNQEFSEGQVVLWSNYSGVSYTYEGEDYMILNQSDIIAVENQ